MLQSVDLNSGCAWLTVPKRFDNVGSQDANLTKDIISVSRIVLTLAGQVCRIARNLAMHALKFDLPQT